MSIENVEKLMGESAEAIAYQKVRRSTRLKSEQSELMGYAETAGGGRGVAEPDVSRRRGSRAS